MHFKWNWNLKRPIKQDCIKASHDLISALLLWGCLLIFECLDLAQLKCLFYFMLVTLRYKFGSVLLMRSALSVLCIMLHLDPHLSLLCSSSLVESMWIFAVNVNDISKTLWTCFFVPYLEKVRLRVAQSITSRVISYTKNMYISGRQHEAIIIEFLWMKATF